MAIFQSKQWQYFSQDNVNICKLNSLSVHTREVYYYYIYSLTHMIYEFAICLNKAKIQLKSIQHTHCFESCRW